MVINQMDIVNKKVGRRYLKPREVAQISSFSIRTLHRWRESSAGPPYVVVNDIVRYPSDLLERWLEDRLVGGAK